MTSFNLKGIQERDYVRGKYVVSRSCYFQQRISSWLAYVTKHHQSRVMNIPCHVTLKVIPLLKIMLLHILSLSLSLSSNREHLAFSIKNLNSILRNFISIYELSTLQVFCFLAKNHHFERNYICLEKVCFAANCRVCWKYFRIVYYSDGIIVAHIIKFLWKYSLMRSQSWPLNGRRELVSSFSLINVQQGGIKVCEQKHRS